MNADDVDRMEAGRYLDAAVAEHVCGWHNMEPPRRAAAGFDSPWRGMPPDKRRQSDVTEPPHYSTDIAAAWQVVDKVNADDPEGSGVEVTSYIDRDGKETCVRLDQIPLVPGTGYDAGRMVRKSHVAYAPTAPLAIARAALKAALASSREPGNVETGRKE